MVPAELRVRSERPDFVRGMPRVELEHRVIAGWIEVARSPIEEDRSHQPGECQGETQERDGEKNAAQQSESPEGYRWDVSAV